MCVLSVKIEIDTILIFTSAYVKRFVLLLTYAKQRVLKKTYRTLRERYFPPPPHLKCRLYLKSTEICYRETLNNVALFPCCVWDHQRYSIFNTSFSNSNTTLLFHTAITSLLSRLRKNNFLDSCCFLGHCWDTSGISIYSCLCCWFRANYGVNN